MSMQAEFCVQLLMLFYAELDQRSGWGVKDKIVEHYKAKGVGAGRTESALASLKSVKMLDERTNNGAVELRLSNYGLDWFEKHFTLVDRTDGYEFNYSAFKSIKLVGPEEFYRKSVLRGGRKANGDINWTKWGAILATIIGLVSLAVTKGWL